MNGEYNQKSNTYWGKTLGLFLISAIALILLFFVSVNVGSLNVSFSQIIKGLFVEYDPQVATVYDLRFPRVFISMIAGASLAVSGVLFQSVLRNPLADPGIIGVTGGAGFFAVLATMVFPSLYFFAPLFAVVGGCISFGLVYWLSWNGSLSPMRILLTGIAIQALFSGLSEGLSSMTGGTLTGVASIVNGNISMKNWSDVSLLAYTCVPTLIVTCFLWNLCDILALEDKTARGVGIDVNKTRLLLSFVGVLLAAFATSVVGSISFLGLLVPNLARILVGSRHNLLIPFSGILGAIFFLGADTLGRSVAYPYEIAPGILMSILGGPAFIVLMRKGGIIHGT